MRYKNILGVINQPEFTIFCPEFLESLPEKEIKAGVSELLKAFILSDRENYFDAIETISEKGLTIDALWPFVKKATKIKAEIVESDPYEKGLRNVLNLGHTFAHGLEKISKISHGEAVSIGIVLAAKLSVNLGYLQVKEQVQIESDFKRIGLATVSPVPVVLLFDSIIRDKKRSQNSISFILIENIGKASAYPLEINKLEEYLNDLS